MVINIIDLEQKICIKWNNANRKWFVEKGYCFTNWGDEFVITAKDLHKGSKIRINATCDYCGKDYSTQYNVFNQGRLKYNKDCCQKCAWKKMHEFSHAKLKHDTYLKLLDKAKEKGYKLLTKEEEYINQSTRIRYECPIHGEQEMLASNFTRKYGCPICAAKSTGEQNKLSIEEVIDRIESVNNNKLMNPEAYIGNMRKNLLVKCSCGELFYTSIGKYDKKYRCKKCAKSESSGEYQIRTYLEKHNIEYMPQYKFEDCKDKNRLPFDFYLPTFNMCIEFDGIQHYFPKRGWGDYEYIHNHDLIKTQYCSDHDINLLRIRYDEQDHINNILDEKLKIM